MEWWHLPQDFWMTIAKGINYYNEHPHKCTANSTDNLIFTLRTFNVPYIYRQIKEKSVGYLIGKMLILKPPPEIPEQDLLHAYNSHFTTYSNNKDSLVLP
jgi:hypothetical protein